MVNIGILNHLPEEEGFEPSVSLAKESISLAVRKCRRGETGPSRKASFRSRGAEGSNLSSSANEYESSWEFAPWAGAIYLRAYIVAYPL